MTYITDSLKKMKHIRRENQHRTLNNESTLFIVIMLLSILVIAIDCNLILKFINVIKNI